MVHDICHHISLVTSGERASFVPMALRNRVSRGRDERMLTRRGGGEPSLDRRVGCQQLAEPERVTAASLMRSSGKLLEQEGVECKVEFWI